MSSKYDSQVDRILSQMTLEQKVGGCLVVDFVGTIANPYVIKMIREFHIAGLRVDTGSRGKASYVDEVKDLETKKLLMRGEREPKGYCKDFDLQVRAPQCSPAEYGQTLNRLREIALERPLGIPLHITLDQEGNGNENFTLGNVRLFPAAMGLAATDDPDLVYQVALALGRQLKAAGFNWIHSPVLDVNANPRNPEVGTRSYSNDFQKVIRYAAATLKGFQESKLIATGKHFPGRGDSETDSHLGLPEVSLSRSQLMETHVKPYVEMIKSGLPAIMIAHTAYPHLDPSGEPATVSEPIVTGLLRRELGFDGVVTTDNMLMGGIVSKYGVAEACIRAILAGQDLLLLRSETPLCEEVFIEIRDAVKSGRIPVQRLDEANRRVLRLKYEYGLFENGGKVDPAQAAGPQNDPVIIAVERAAAEKATLVRNEQNILPLAPNTKVLLVEQVHSTHTTFNNFPCHPSIFWEKMLDVADNVYAVEITDISEKNQQRVMRRVPKADVIAVTNYVARRSSKDISPLIRELMQTGKPMVVVTNSPFEFGSPRDLPTVVNVFSANPESLRVAAEIIFGKRNPQGVNPLL